MALLLRTHGKLVKRCWLSVPNRNPKLAIDKTRLRTYIPAMADDEDRLGNTLGRLIHVLIFVVVSYGLCALAILAAQAVFSLDPKTTLQRGLILLAAFGPFGILNAIFYIFRPQNILPTIQRMLRFGRQ